MCRVVCRLCRVIYKANNTDHITLQHIQHTATHYKANNTDHITLQHITTHCNTLQHTAIYCNTLQHTATDCNRLQHTATHCTTLQHTQTKCNTLQQTATHCRGNHAVQHTTWHLRLGVLDIAIRANGDRGNVTTSEGGGRRGAGAGDKVGWRKRR